MSELAAQSGIGSGRGIARVLSDERLARRATEGDEAAFATIFRRYHQRLYRYCMTILGNSQDAQDALQNTMVKALRALPGEERKVDLKPWLYRIAHNESIDLLRRRRETGELDVERAAAGPGLAEKAATRERLGRLISDLDELPERQRGALVMRELAGLEFAEIGTALGTSAAVARQTLYEARMSLRQMDEGRDMSCGAVTRALSDGDGRVTRRRDVRAHLRSCQDCRRFGEEIERRGHDLAALSPLPAVAAAGLLQSLFGGSGTGGGGLATLLGGGAAKSAGMSVALKGAAAVAVVATIGVTAADRGGLIDTAPSGGGGSPATLSRESGGTESGAGARAEVSGSATAAGDRAGSDRGRSGDVAGAVTLGAANGKTGSEGGDPVGGAASPTGTSSPDSHPHGRGHAKQLPAASAHGQQTAATHKAVGKGAAGHPVHPSHPEHPPHPAPPDHPDPPPAPSPEKGSTSQGSPSGPTGEHSQGGGNATPETPLAEPSP